MPSYAEPTPDALIKDLTDEEILSLRPSLYKTAAKKAAILALRWFYTNRLIVWIKNSRLIKWIIKRRLGVKG